jgi:hypothetical protein
MVKVIVLTPLLKTFSYIMAVNFIGGGYRSHRKKPPTCRKSLTNLITYCYIEYTSPWAGFDGDFLYIDFAVNRKSIISAASLKYKEWKLLGIDTHTHTHTHIYIYIYIDMYMQSLLITINIVSSNPAHGEVYSI